MKEKLLIRIVSRISIQLFSIFSSYLLTLYLEVELIGIIGFATSFIDLFSMFIQIGFTNIYLQKNAEENFEEYFSVFFFFQTIVYIGNYIFLLFFCLFLSFEPILLSFLILKLISVIFTQFTGIFSTNLISKMKIYKTEISALITNITRSIIIIFIAFNLNSFTNPLNILGQTYVCISLLSFIITLVLSKGEFSFKKLNKINMKNFINATKPLMLSYILSMIVKNLGKVLLDINYGHESLAYYYIVDSYIIFFLLLISGQIDQLFASYFPKKFEEKNIKSIEILTHKAEKYSSIFFLSIIIFVFLNGKLLFKLFLPNYIDSVIYLYILILIPFSIGISRPYFSHLIPSKRQDIFAKYTLTKHVITFFLILILVPTNVFSINMLGFGALGLSILMTTISVIDIFMSRYFSYKIGIPSNKKIINHIIYAIVAFFLTYFFSLYFLRNMIFNDLIYITISSILLLSIFSLELLMFKEIGREDLKFILELLKISSHKKSIIKEFRKTEVTNNVHSK